MPSAPPTLAAAFAAARAVRRPALIGYLPAGFPDLPRSVEALAALGGRADLLEVGLPYTDPVLDGRVIRRAAEHALRAGFRTADLFTAVRELAPLRPVLAMTYWNPVARYGPERFAERLAAAGAAGVVLPDLPLEESGRWLPAARAHGLHTVPVLDPRAGAARTAAVCASASGFVYLPAAPGPTGHGTGPAPGLAASVAAVRAATRLPIGVGIGVSTPAQAAEVGRRADAVIVGSALVERLAAARPGGGAAAVADLAGRLAAAVRTCRHPAPGRVRTGERVGAR